VVYFLHLVHGMKSLEHILILVILAMFALLETLYIAPFGLHWLLITLAGTVIVAGFWMRAYWDNSEN
jgi:hypothetical protein